MRWLIKFFLLTLVTSALAQNQSAVSETYKFDPGHTYVLWHVSHFGFSLVSGKFMADGILTLDRKNPRNSKVNVTIHTNPIDTGIAELNDTLAGQNFFYLEKYQTATFVSNKIEVTGSKTGKVYGTLTIKNISKPAVLDMKLTQEGMHPYFHKKALGFSGITTLKRSEFDMTGYIPGVADQVQIDIQAEAEYT